MHITTMKLLYVQALKTNDIDRFNPLMGDLNTYI